jgi:hypothetical protein
MRPDQYGHCKTFAAVHRDSGIQKTCQAVRTYFAAGTRLLQVVASGKSSNYISLLKSDEKLRDHLCHLCLGEFRVTLASS